jgi:hypothetical protein
LFLSLFVIVLLIIEIDATAAQDTGLFVDIGEIPFESGIQVDDPTIIRTRFVRPDFRLLMGTEPLPDVGVLPLNLFDDAVFMGIIERVEENRSGSTTWTGRLDGIALSSFTLATRDGIMMGTVKIPGAFYRIGYLQAGVHVVHQMDEGAFPPELEPLQAEAIGDTGAQSSPAADDGSVIDVLVVYTDDARAGEGGTTAIETLIALAVAETNTSYGNSGITQQLNQVHSAEVAYNETSFNWYTTLDRLTNPADGYMDEVHTIRNSYCADEVVLLVDNMDSCGIAWVNSSASSAFAVVSTDCATGYYSFGHELGHNMGARHDWYVDDTDTYAHAYVNFPDRWRTIMAYNNDCSDRGYYCTRLPYWSNPFVSYGSDPMGVENGTSRSCIEDDHDPGCDADNHLKLNSTALTVSNFRDSAVCAPSHSISGYVRDTVGTGISGVTADFDGAQPAITTNGDGFYTQSGFANGDYTVSFTKSGYSFSPFEDQVTISDGNATHDATGYPFSPASLPFNDGFESGSLGSAWAVETDYEGRVGVYTSYPNQGSYSLLLDDETNLSHYSHAAAILALDLSGQTQVDLSFWWREFGDEEDDDDGVFISDDGGDSWYQAISFNGNTEMYTQTIIDLDSAASAAGMSFNDHFLVKFQFYDNYPITSDGYAIDDVWVSAPVGPLIFEDHIVNDDNVEDSHGDDDGIAECGEIIELFVNLTNQGSTTATLVTSTLSTTDTYVTFLDNTSSSYPDIPGGATEDNNNDYDIEISSNIPDGYTIPFVLDITALNGGPWTDNLYITAGCSRVYLPLVLK